MVHQTSVPCDTLALLTVRSSRITQSDAVYDADLKSSLPMNTTCTTLLGAVSAKPDSKAQVCKAQD